MWNNHDSTRDEHLQNCRQTPTWSWRRLEVMAATKTKSVEVVFSLSLGDFSKIVQKKIVVFGWPTFTKMYLKYSKSWVYINSSYYHCKNHIKGRLYYHFIYFFCNKGYNFSLVSREDCFQDHLSHFILYQNVQMLKYFI